MEGEEKAKTYDNTMALEIAASVTKHHYMAQLDLVTKVKDALDKSKDEERSIDFGMEIRERLGLSDLMGEYIRKARHFNFIAVSGTEITEEDMEDDFFNDVYDSIDSALTGKSRITAYLEKGVDTAGMTPEG